MLPYIDVPPIQFGGFITLQPFGLLVVTGCLVGYGVGRWHAGSLGLDQRVFRSFTLWVLVPAFFMAHWLSIVLYYPEVLWRDPLSLMRINMSLSSFGGLFGAVLGAASYWKLYGQSCRLALRSYRDVVAVGWIVGWFFGRLGCTLAHDHPGLPSDFALAVPFPTGTRHDLGLYEWLYTIGLNLLVFSIRGRQPPAGMFLGPVSVCYAAGRFLLDFLRAQDIRYMGLTPGQYCSMVLLLFGISFLATMPDNSTTDIHAWLTRRRLHRPQGGKPCTRLPAYKHGMMPHQQRRGNHWPTSIREA